MTAELKERFNISLRKRIGMSPPILSESKLAAAGIYIKRLLNAVEVDLPQQEDIQAVADKIWTHYTGGPDTWSFKPRALRLSGWALFASAKANPGSYLIAEPGLLEWYETICRTRFRARAVLALVHSYLFNFGESNQHQEKLRQLCKKAIEWADSPKLERQKMLLDQHRLLEPDGPEWLSETFEHSSKTAAEFIQEIGMGGGLSGSGYLRATALHIGKTTRRRLSQRQLTTAELDRVLDFHFVDTSARKFFRSSAGDQSELAENLLLPFVDDDPAPDIQLLLKNFLIQHWGDPRLDRSNWWRVSDTAQAALRRWLVQETLEDFFRLLDHQSQFYEDADRQWRYRSAFWQAYLRGGFITDAWVALGHRVREDASKFLKASSIRYGNLKSGDGARPDHAVLILRVGSLVVVEWSHSAKCRVWLADDEQVPQFYRKQYQRQELVTGSDYEQIHHSAATGSWQGTLANYIKRRTGIKMGLRSLMPND